MTGTALGKWAEHTGQDHGMSRMRPETDYSGCTAEGRTLSVWIDSPVIGAYVFAYKPENFAKWAMGSLRSLRSTNRGWVIETSTGEATVRFSELNGRGILDFSIDAANRPPLLVRLRMMSDRQGTRVEWERYLKPGTTIEDFERETQAITAELATLKTLIENDL